MKCHLLLLAALMLAMAPASAQVKPVPSFDGSYELAGKHADRDFSLEVKLTGRRARVSFSAAMADGSGAAPDADGTGKVEDGVLTFKFKDSSDNEGTCKLQPLPSGLYQLDMVVSKVVEPSPLHFYGTLQLKKLPDRTMTP